MHKIKVSVPGSIMLMGEHSVLFGEKALACAVASYIHIELEPLPDRQVIIDSALAQYRASLDALTDDPALSFVLEAIRQQAAQLPCGFKLTIHSEFSHQVGLGSSAAVTAGTVAALAALAGQDTTAQTLFTQALAVVHSVQGGRGSGTDLVASIFGGIVAYRVNPCEISAVQATPPLALYYAGYKTKTPDVLKLVEQLSQHSPDIYQQLYQLMGQVTAAAENAVASADWPQLGRLMNQYQGLMDALGVSDHTISDIVYRLREGQHVLGSKISGSGLGDCVLALGDAADLNLPYEKIPVAVSEQGVCIEYH